MLVLRFSFLYAINAMRTIGRGIPNFPVVPDEEREIFSHNITDPTAMGLITHFWSTACGGRAIDWDIESGISIYRYYIDGETTPSIEFQPRMGSAIGPFSRTPAPAPGPAPGPGEENPELYMVTQL